MSFWELIIAYPNGSQWPSSANFFPPWLKPLVTPLVPACDLPTLKNLRYVTLLTHPVADQKISQIFI